MKPTHTAIACAIVPAAGWPAQAQCWTTSAPVPLPSIPSGMYNITSYGASTGSVNNATAIQNAINAAPAAGDGTVQVPAGTFLSGPIHLTDQIFTWIGAMSAASIGEKMVRGAGFEPATPSV